MSGDWGFFIPSLLKEQPRAYNPAASPAAPAASSGVDSAALADSEAAKEGEAGAESRRTRAGSLKGEGRSNGAEAFPPFQKRPMARASDRFCKAPSCPAESSAPSLAVAMLYALGWLRAGLDCEMNPNLVDL